VLRIALLVLLVPSVARAALIYTAPPEAVVPHADLVVRGTLDLETGRIAVRKVYRGEAPEDGLVVRNVEKVRALAAHAPGPLADDGPTDDAFLFLQEHDGRHYLVHTSSPWWIAPHAAIYYVRRDGRMLGFHQVINPGSPVLRPVREEEGPTAEVFEKKLAAWLDLPRVEREKRPAMSPEETRRFHELVDRVLDTHLRRAREQIAIEWVAETAEKLAAQAAATTGEPRDRRIEALLLLAEQKGADQSRHALVEKVLFGLLDEIGPEPFLEPVYRELRSVDVFSSKRTAALLLRRIGGEPVTRARRILVGLVVETDDISLVTSAYWALKYMGLEKDAETALDARRKLREGR